MQQVRSLVQKVARSMAPVLVHGESGTGKELVARAIHECSPRCAGPFRGGQLRRHPRAIAGVRVLRLPQGRLHRRQRRPRGLFPGRAGWHLFLDEIGDLPLPMQSKLLRVIQERAVRPMGAVAETPVNVRIVSATHRDLGNEVQAGRFRQDLYYRLNVIRIAVPPLRERIADLPGICAAVLERVARDAGVTPVPTLATDALQHLLRYGFPGNVRELENLLHRALALSGGPQIGRDELGLPEELLQDTMPDNLGDSAQMPLHAAVAAAPTASLAPSEALPTDLAAYLDEVERDILERALERHRYNRTAAGASLGLSLRQMRYRMARLRVGAADAEGP
jgi:two-component system response regulator PilR (NtrC family)